MDYFDRDHAERAEGRRRERLARQERQASVRRKRLRAFGLVMMAFALSYAGAVLAHAAKKPAASRVLRVAAASATVRVPRQVLVVAASEEPASEPTRAAEPRPEPKPEPAPAAPEPKATSALPSSAVAERVRIDIGTQGYEPDVVRVKAGVPVTITVGRGQGCAAGFLMPDLGITKDNSNGPVTFRLGPLKPGTYRFTCGMEMVAGQLIAS